MKVLSLEHQPYGHSTNRFWDHILKSRFLPSCGKGQDAFVPVECLECQKQPCGSAFIPIHAVAAQLAWSGIGPVG